MNKDIIAAEANDRISDPDRFTLNDLHLAGVYWPVLMQVAKDNQHRHIRDFTLIQYADLVALAKRNNTEDLVVKNAINTSIGRKLDPINWFCRKHGLPNLSCLAVNANGEPGTGYLKNNNWESEKAEVAAFDWSSCNLQFNETIKERAELRLTKAAAQRKEMDGQKARNLLWDWWDPKRHLYPDLVQQKEEVLALIRKWIPVEEAVAAVLGIE